MKTLHFSIIIAGTIFAIVFGISIMFIEANAISSTNQTQFQLKVNQTFSIESYGITVKFLNVTSDSRCPSDVTCIWQGEAKVLVHIIENNQDRGNFILSTLVGHDQIVFGTHTLHLMQVIPPVSSNKKISNIDYEITLEMSSVNVESPLQQFKSGVSIQNINCESYYTLVIKAQDGSPACLKFKTAKILIEKGWSNDAFIAIMEPHYGGIAGQNGTGTYIIDVLIEKSNQTTPLLFHIFYPNGTQYKEDSVSTSEVQPDRFYKYSVTVSPSSSQPIDKEFNVQITYYNETKIIHLPSFCCDIPKNPKIQLNENT